jgi:hypothetical protein
LNFISTTKQAIDMVQATKLIRKIERRWPAKKLSDLVKLVVTCPQSQQSTTTVFLRQTSLLPPTMKGHKSSQELCEIIIRMLPLLDTSKIMAYTGASKSTIEKIARCYQLTGKPYKESRSGGRARIMDLEDIEVRPLHSISFCTNWLWCRYSCSNIWCRAGSTWHCGRWRLRSADLFLWNGPWPWFRLRDDFWSWRNLNFHLRPTGGLKFLFGRTAAFPRLLVIAHSGRSLRHPARQCSRPGKVSCVWIWFLC